MSTALYGNFTLSSNANDSFLSSVPDDVMIFPDSNSQRVHIGVNKGVAPAICVTSNGVGVGGQSNPQYPLDVLGQAHFSGGVSGFSCTQIFNYLPGSGGTNYSANAGAGVTYGSNSSNFALGTGTKYFQAVYDVASTGGTQSGTTWAYFSLFNASGGAFVMSLSNSLNWGVVPNGSGDIKQAFNQVVPNSTLPSGTYYVRCSYCNTNTSYTPYNDLNSQMNLCVVNFPF